MATQTLPQAAFKQNWLPLTIAVVATTVAASLFYTPLLVVVLLGIPFLAYFISRPYELLLLMVFLIPFNFIFTIGSIPVAAELLKVFLWIPFLISRGNRRFLMKGSRYNKWYAVLAGLILLSIPRAHDLPYTIKESVRLGSNIGLCYLALNLVDSKEKVVQVFRVLTVSTFLVACYGFYQWAIQDFGALFWIVNPRLNTSLSHYRDDFWQWRNRIVSVLTSEMELGHYFNLCLPIAVFLWITAGRKRLTSKWFLITLSMLAGLLLTFTFGAWLALASTAGFFVFFLDKKNRWKMIAAGLLGLSVSSVLLLFSRLRPYVEDKLLGNGMGSLAWDVLTRLDSWFFALQAWWSHPLFGGGIGSFEFLYASHDYVLGAKSQGTSPHETYLYLLANLGIVGTLSILVVMIGTIRRNLNSSTQQRHVAFALAFALCTNMVGWLFDDSGFFGPHASYLVWLLLGLSEAVWNLPLESGELGLHPFTNREELDARQF
jgi:hypothetical protein